jgi:DNA end-binding protein Ku
MAARSAWKGYLKLSLVSVPVKAYTAAASGSGEIHLNQLHAECNNRIQYKKTCPIHVKGDQIVSGYEYSKDQYFIIDTDELDKLRSEDDKAVKIDAFISANAIDPAHFTGKNYYLVPDGPVGLKPFAVVYQAMTDEKRHAVAQVVMHGKEQLVVIRPLDNLFVMSVISFEHQVNKPATFADEVPPVEVAPDELNLAKMLIKSATPKMFDLSKYQDVYTQKLTKLIEAKVAGQEIVAAPAQEHAHVINLMEALKQSVAKAQEAAEAKEPAMEKPPKKMAASTRGAAAARKKKSS